MKSYMCWEDVETANLMREWVEEAWPDGVDQELPDARRQKGLTHTCQSLGGVRGGHIECGVQPIDESVSVKGKAEKIVTCEKHCDKTTLRCGQFRGI